MFRKKAGIARERVLELQHEIHCERTARRQAAKRAELDRAGVPLKVRIGSGHVAPHIARVFTYVKVA